MPYNMYQRIFVFLITIVCSSASFPQSRVVRNTNHPESGDDIQFDVADITTQLDYPTTTVTLEAFRVRNRTRSGSSKWVSIGYPMIIKDRNGQIFNFAPEHVTVKITVLDAMQKQILFQTAKDHYPNENIKIGNIIPLPLVQFACRLTFYLNGTRYEFQGSVYDLRRSPFTLRFPVHEGSNKRIALETRLQSNHPLILECELAATGKQEKINTLRITAEQLQSMDLADKLLGPADEKFVSRKQLQQLSQEIRTNLHIEEEYEIENEDFSEEFIHKILESSHARFEPVPIDEALAQLSRYGIKINDRDLTPNEIKRELSDIFQVSTEGNKSHIATGRNHGLTSAQLDMISSDINYALKKSDNWKKDISSLDDQIQDLNTHSQSGIKWELEGSRIIPKSLDVAKVTRVSLRQHMSFSRIKKRITSEKYYRRYELSTEASEALRESNDQLFRRIAELEKLYNATDENSRALNHSLIERIVISEQSLYQNTSRMLDPLLQKIAELQKLYNATNENSQRILALDQLIQQNMSTVCNETCRESNDPLIQRVNGLEQSIQNINMSLLSSLNTNRSEALIQTTTMISSAKNKSTTTPSTANNSNTIYFATTHGLYVSDDDGQKWSIIFAWESIYTMAVTGPNWAVAKTAYRHNSNLFPISISTDGGQTWTTKDFMLEQGEGGCRPLAATTRNIFLLGKHVVQRLEHDKNLTTVLALNTADHAWSNSYASGNSIYVYETTNSAGTYLYISHDNGQTWSIKHLNIKASCGISAEGDKIYINKFDNPAGLVHSMDGGNTWTTISAVQVGYGDSTVLTVAAKGDKVFVGTGKGLAISHDNGASWRKELLGKCVYTCVLTTSETLYCCSVDVGTYRKRTVFVSNDYGVTFKEIPISFMTSSYAHRDFLLS